MSTFQHLGFIKEFYIGTKFIGSIKTDNDREKIGYEGRKIEILLDEIITDNRKKIKKGTEVMTIIYPMSGKWNGD